MSKEFQVEESILSIELNSQLETIVEDEEQHRERIRQDVIGIIPPEDRHFLLLDSGFDVARQVGMLVEMSEQSDFQNVKDVWLKKTQEDMFHFLWEFLIRKPVLPINIAIEDGELIAPRYGNRKLIDATNETWRNGAVKRAVKNLSSLLVSSPFNTMCVMTSPMGWVGPGSEVKESQTYLYRKNEDSTISGLTLRTSMDLEGHEELLRRLASPTNNSGGQISRIINVSETITSQTDLGFKDIAIMIREIMGTEIAWIDESTGREILFGEIFENLDKIPKADGAIQILVDEFISFADLNFNEISKKSLVELAIELGKTVIRMRKALEIMGAKETDVKELAGPDYRMIIATTYLMPPDEYRMKSEEIRILAGCTSANTNSSISIDSVWGPRNISTEGWHNGTCRICHVSTWVGPCSICSSCASKL